MPTEAEWRDIIRDSNSSAAGINASTPEASPEAAARTLRNATKAGVPYSTGSGDPERFNQEVESAENANLARTDPVLRNYFATYDWAGSISQVDTQQLAKAGNMLRQVGRDIYDVAAGGVKQTAEAIPELIGTVPPSKEVQDTVEQTVNWMVEHGVAPDKAELEGDRIRSTLVRNEALQGLLFGPFTALASPAIGAYRALVSRPIEEATGFPKEVTEGLTMAGLAAIHTTLSTAGLYHAAGESPKPGVDYNLDRINIEQSKTDNANLEATSKALDATKTKQLSPEATKGFVESAVGDKRISISADAIDSILGDRAAEEFKWQPDFQKQLQMAREGGGDVSVRLDDWNAFATPELREALKGDTRVRPAGLTPREREALETAKPEQYPPDELYVDNEQLKALSESLKTQIAEAEKVGLGPEDIDLLKARKSLVDRQTIKPKSPARQTVERELWLKPLFDENTFSRFMTKSVFADYSKSFEMEATEANSAEFARQQREIAKRQTTEWKTNREKVREDVNTDFQEKPIIMADKFLRTGRYFGEKVRDFKLNRGDVPVRYNQLFERYTVPKGGVHPDDIAGLFGYDSSRAMLEDLLTLDQRRGETQPATHIRQLIDAETNRQMEAKYGVLQDNILKETREAVGTGGQADILANEMFTLGRSEMLPIEDRMPAKFTREYIEGRINDLFRASKAAQSRSVETFVRDVGKAQRQAEAALLKGDIKAAFQAKQKGFVAFQFMRQAQKFEKTVEWTENTVKRYGQKQIVESVDQPYVDQIHNILGDMGLGKRFPIPKNTPSLEGFVRSSEGKVEVAYWLKDLGDKPAYKDLTVDQYRAFSDSLRSLIEAGRDARKVVVAEGKADLDTAAKELKEGLDRFKLIPQDRLNPTVKQRIGSNWRLVQAKLLLAERVMDYSDKNDPNGPMMRYIDNPLRQASARELELQEQVRSRLQDMQKYTDSSINDMIPNNLIPSKRNGTGFMRLNRHNLRMIALYMGDEERATKLVKGFGLVDPTIEEFYGANSREILNDAFAKVEKFLKDNMTENDWRWVVGHWGIFDYLKPEADATHIRDTGVPVDETPRRSMNTIMGKVDGGYTPLVYDKLETRQVPVGHDLFEPNYQWASTQKGYTKALTQYAEPLDLTGALMPSKIMGMVHDIAFREAIRSVDKIIRHPDFRDAMIDKWGKEIYDMFPRWLRDLANVQNIDDSYVQSWTRASVFFRQNLTSSLIFFNPRTVTKHGLTATALSATQGGFRPLAKASAELWAKEMVSSIRDIQNSPKLAPPTPEYVDALKELTDQGEKGQSTMQFIMDNSPMMRNRQVRFNDSLREAYKKASEAGTLRTFFNIRAVTMDIGRTPVAWSDAFSAFPTWLMNYKRVFGEGFSREEAALQADKAVTRAHGSTLLMDKPAATRSRNELYRWFTPFYNFWNHAANFQTQIGWDLAAYARGAEEPGANIPSLANKIFKTAMVPILVEEFANLSWSDKHESWGSVLAKAVGRFFGGMIPGVREVSNWVLDGREPSVGMLTTAARTAQAARTDAQHLITGKKLSENWATHFTAAIGGGLGIGGPQVGRTGTFTVDYLHGKNQPVTFDQWMRALFTGHAKPPRGH
ncbi:MAG TPA: hypothetical protein VH187_05355 [Scandinavium sp.]|jgi:hypothetical protein|uniref:hypothetical protein n=1 Tax=Scandinavium sp. TaxID=2830653 RepID=UPI002E3623AB|nr:hypothetical protein [Scandinavium sp.]HEX4500587.1 hypothetical protein [Scandinavium sp.]